MDPLLVKIVTAVIGALVSTIGLLWNERRAQIKRLEEEVNKWQTRFLDEHSKRLEDLKEHGRTSEMFRLALEKKQKQFWDETPRTR